VSFWQLAADILPDLLTRGTVATILYTAVSITLGFFLGILLAMGKVYARGPLRALCASYIAVIRGTPLVTQLFIVYFGLPSVGIVLSPLVAAVLGLGLNSAAYQAEYFRGAIQSVPEGQVTAARAIGLSQGQAFLRVVLPQTLRLVIPSWSNELVYLVKYSSLVYLVQAPELMFQAKVISARNYRHFEVYLVVAAIYLALVLLLTWLLSLVERRLHIPGLGTRRRIFF